MRTHKWDIHLPAELGQVTGKGKMHWKVKKRKERRIQQVEGMAYTEGSRTKMRPVEVRNLH